MNGVIKFRAWGGETVKYFVHFDIFSEGGQDYFTDEERQPDGSRHILSFSDIEAIQQFTGLTDKNGKDIYEGDIVRTRNGDTQVIWWLAGFYFKYLIDKGRGDFVKLDSKEMEIIGNIYENSDLLV